jgi:hypothetical protein
MKAIALSTALFIISYTAVCQPVTADMQKQYDELKIRIKALEKENGILKSQDRFKDSIAYCLLRSEIFEAFTGLPQLDFDFKRTIEKIAVTGLFTKLMQANNPTSDILGFRFTDVIFNASEKHFRTMLKNDQDKRRFSQVISKIVDNPVISSLANTNPVTSVVAAIISTIAGFTTSKVDIEKDGGKVQDVTVSQEDAFDHKSITAFRDELQVYIDFYDALIIASSDYLEGLEELNAKYAYLVKSVSDYKSELYSALDVNENNLLLRLTRLLPDPAIKQIDYHLVFNDPVIIKSQLLARKFPVLQLAVNDFKKDYNALLFNYLNTYIKTLGTAHDFPDENIDKSKTEELISDIKSFIECQKTKTAEELDAFK